MAKKLIKKSDYQNLFDRHPMARFILDVADDGTCSYANTNQAAQTAFGIRGDDITGQAVPTIFNTDLSGNIKKALKTCIRYKRAVTINMAPIYPGIVQEQSFILNPILNKKGHVYLIDMMATANDAQTNQLQLERDTAIEFMTAIFDSSNLGVLVTDKHRRIIRVNDAFLETYHYKRRDLSGEDFTKILIDKYQKVALDHHEAFLRGDGPKRNEWRITCCKGKKTTDVLVTTARLDFNIHRPLFIHTFVDISEQKNIEESLRWAKDEADGANRAKSAFLANMSHELRTPLNAIIGFSEVIRGEIFGPINNNKYKEYLTDIHFSAQHLLEIINDVLDMSKIEAGKFTLYEKEVDLVALFESVRRIIIERAEVKGIQFTVDLDDNIPPIYADKRVMRQMLLNLVANAVKFTGKGDHVTLSAHVTKNGTMSIKVKDTGQGIAQDNLDKVLEPFSQAYDPSINTGQNGTGLGLSLTQAMAKLHGGSLAIKSKLGKGTTVTITLPKTRVLSIPEALQEIA